ncbi:uncharacterized protein LOC122501848 [Leptopilina heterotoma]|uniref:uncharacterized protein LOC122501848 n=1 Tax=Leptopilina heterotoma TaxID=63436 RepID=UPI001CA9BDFD|nr:uncharacterized protein LOC122501848 [Leptopilina heterotoma]
MHLSLHTYDVVALSETWLTEEVDDSTVNISDSNFVRRDRNGKRGGGVAVYVKKYLGLRVLYSSPCDFDNKPEYIIIEISSKDVKPLLFANTSDSNYVRDFFDSFNLFIVPFAATHHTANSSSWLDLCVVDDKDKLIAISQSQAPFVADHELISISYRWEFENKTCSTKSYRNLSLIDDCTFLSTLRSFNWSCFNQSQSVDNKQSLISEAITSALDEHAPLHNHVIRGKVCPWMNDEIRDLIYQRDSAFRAWKRGGNALTRSNFKKLRNKVKSLVKQARDRYNTGRLKNITDSEKLWKELRRIGIAKDKRDDSPLNFNVNIINDYFLSVCGDSSFNVTPSFISNLLVNYEFNDGLFFFEDICPSTLLKALKSIKTEAQGSDGLSISYIMKGIPVLFPYVLDLFNMSLQTSIFPEDWKRVLIKPIGKVKVPQQPGDYRPIAILSSLSKVLEKVVFYQLNKFVETNDVLSPFQSGYRKGFSTQTLLAGATDDICKAIDQKKVTIVVFFDFSKAFDSVPHTILLSKLKAIESQDIGDRKPSQFLRHLRGPAGLTVTDAMLKTLWSGRLPVAMQPILAVQKDASLDKLAEMADHIHDLTRSKPIVAETSRITEDLVQQFTRVLTSLKDKVKKLRLEVSEIRGNNGPHKSRARSRSRGNYAAEGVCWYHARHGPNATKCTTPCSYKAGNAKASA